MFAYVVRRLWQIVPTLLGVVLLVFFLFTWFGGDPAYLLAGKISNPEQIESIRRQLGVDRPYYVQLWIFIQQIATGDFGESWSTNEKVSAIFATRLGPSLTVLVLAENLLKYSLLPIIVGVIVSLAPDTRLYRSFFLDEINQDYVRTARAKGMSETRVMWVHVLRNASIPIITNVMIQLPGLLAGAFLIERFFSIPGIGREVILAVERSDFPVIKAVTIYVAIATMIINLITDLLYKVVDPRVQLK